METDSQLENPSMIIGSFVTAWRDNLLKYMERPRVRIPPPPPSIEQGASCPFFYGLLMVYSNPRQSNGRFDKRRSRAERCHRQRPRRG